MNESVHTPDQVAVTPEDPRTRLSQWANETDEWVRLLVAEVIATGRPVEGAVVDQSYQLFRQEKALDPRTLPVVGKLEIEARQDEAAPRLSIGRLSEVRGVNALARGAIIEPHDGLTILYGENGTGKTGYARIFKALADSRTADEILGNIEGESEGQAAKVEFTLGTQTETLEWFGQRGVAPFTRMSIFDNPCVTTHVDDDLDYVYVPAALALFSHVISAIQAVAGCIDNAVTNLTSGSSTLLSRFARESSIYPFIETLGASTDLEALKAKVAKDPRVDEKLDALAQAVAALRANTLAAQLTGRRRDQRVLDQTAEAVSVLLGLDLETYNATLKLRTQLSREMEVLRSELFATAELPAEPDDTWNAFVEAGDHYREHLVGVGAHDSGRCLYCRQMLSSTARDLLANYVFYLDDKIASDIRDADAALRTTRSLVASIASNELTGLIQEFLPRDEEDKPSFFASVETVDAVRRSVAAAIASEAPVKVDVAGGLAGERATVEEERIKTDAEILSIEEQARNRDAALAEKQSELIELAAARELAQSWASIESQVKNAKEADRLRLLKKSLPKLSRGLTELSKAASDQLINQSFDSLFIEECDALRAPRLKLQFVGREGKAQRRKVLSGRHKPSKVLSEGEQKVLALADFLAEARLAGITAPVVFDDPVSSLDHRRINEVAQRVASLAEDNQVIVLTHDIFFATTLLSLLEKSKRCSYYQVTDEDGKGKVARATGPRWDTLSGIKGKVNATIEAAKLQDGEARDALVRTGYDWVRAWCEVFTETELLQGVTQRYQPNVGMTRLQNINTATLADIIPRATEVFEAACRFIDGHSQPLPTLGVTPTLSGLEAHWQELQDLKKLNDGKS